jgi:hypothetical protein
MQEKLVKEETEKKRLKRKMRKTAESFQKLAREKKDKG